jgi:hypothetical protein
VDIGSLCSKENYPELIKQMYLLKENHVWSKPQPLAHYFPVRIVFVFERNASCKTQFSRWRKAHFLPNRPIQLGWRNKWISWRKSSVLEVGASSTIFPL